MPLSTGDRLGPYDILARIGAGGMGAVYKARDPRLERFVALKVLHPDALRDSAAKKRFLKEAQTASALNHPHIITIYEVGSSDGVDFIAMEFVAGRTLRQAIGRKGLPLKKAVSYAVEIASALAKAHAADIVHRDLKPSNIMIAEDGGLKLLDFGIAKLAEHEHELAEQDPELTGHELERAQHERETDITETFQLADTHLTRASALVGTLPYMSPEQLQRQKVDARSDIFSFGVLLYEMLTGRRAFHGESSSEVMSAILRGQPLLEREVAMGFSPDIATILKRCLRKEPTRRFQHMDDVKIALEDVLEDLASASSDAPLVAPAPASRVRPPLWWIAVIAAASIALGGLLAWTMLPRAANTGRLIPLTADLDFAIQPAPSPDGKLVVYAADPEGEGRLSLWVRQVAGGPPVRITHDLVDDVDPAFSPDGSKIVFRSERDHGQVYVVPALGGEPLPVARQGWRPRFSPDGRWIVYWIKSPRTGWGEVYVVPASGGSPRRVAEDFADAHAPVWAPDSRSVLICGTPSRPAPGKDLHDWWVVSLDSNRAVRTRAYDHFRAIGVAAGETVPSDWFQDRVLFSAHRDSTFDVWQVVLQGGNVRGDPVRITFGTAAYLNPLFMASGRMVFTSTNNSDGVWSLPVAGNEGRVTGAMKMQTAGAQWSGSPSISSDGRYLVFVRAHGTRYDDDLELMDLQSGRVRPLTRTPLREFFPVITRDGKRVAYRVNNRAVTKGPVFAIPTEGGEPEKLCDGCDRPTSWSPGGNAILLMTGQKKQINLLDLREHRVSEYLNLKDWDTRNGRFSPDGRWIAFLAGRGQGTRPYVIPYRPGPAPKPEDWIVATEADVVNDDVDWSPDGRLLYFVFSDRGKKALWARRFDGAVGTFRDRPFLVYPFTDVRHPPSDDFSFSVALDKIVWGGKTLTSQVWLMEP